MDNVGSNPTIPAKLYLSLYIVTTKGHIYKYFVGKTIEGHLIEDLVFLMDDTILILSKDFDTETLFINPTTKRMQEQLKKYFNVHHDVIHAYSLHGFERRMEREMTYLIEVPESNPFCHYISNSI